MTDTPTTEVPEAPEVPDAASGAEGFAIPTLAAPPDRAIAIVGYTNSRAEAPWDDPKFERWICNDLHKYVPDKWDRLYDLHPNSEIAKDAEHEAFLRGCRKPVYVFEPTSEWPASVAFPKDEAAAAFGRYFTNSISWMIAHAVMEIVDSVDAWAAEQAAEVVAANPGLEALQAVLAGAARVDALARSQIHVYGVDMAQGTEYAAQRPSCEYFLGLARGMGIQTFVPLTSDLLKNITLYGAEDDSAFRAKLLGREADLVARQNEMTNQFEQLKAHLYQLQGALEDVRYWKGVWLNAHAERDGSAKGAALPTQSDGQGTMIDLSEPIPASVG